MRRIFLFAFAVIALLFFCHPLEARRAPEKLQVIQLPRPLLNGEMSVEQAFVSRRSVRRFNPQPLDMIQIGQLAWAGQGVTDSVLGYRTAPSAGALYPLELYVMTSEGKFRYNPGKHSLEQFGAKDIREAMSEAALGQQSVASAPCVILIGGDVRKLSHKYKGDARRFMLMEAGHVAQNILLQSVSMDLASVPVGAFHVKKMRKACRVPADVEPLYLVCVGRKVSEGQSENAAVKKMKAKRAVMIIASQGFRDEELFETREKLEGAGVKVDVASTEPELVLGMRGAEVRPDVLLDDVEVDRYDAVIFVGGVGAVELFDYHVAHEIAQQAVEKRKVLGAICIAPSILANAGVCQGVRMTAFRTEKANLVRHGATFTAADVERDKLIVTANGPKASSAFGEKIVEVLSALNRN